MRVCAHCLRTLTATQPGFWLLDYSRPNPVPGHELYGHTICTPLCLYEYLAKHYPQD